MVDPKYGRWEVRGRDIVRNGYDGGGLIGKAGGDFYDDGRKDKSGRTTEPILDTLANATLMAAAPDLLAALKMADECVWGDVSEVAAWLSFAKQAIAKAEGKVK